MGISIQKKNELTTQLHHLVGSLLWISQGTRPDIAVITSLLAQHQNKSSSGHIDAAKHVIRYLKGTADIGIAFHSDQALQPSSFLHFPVSPTKVTGFSDANWGPQ